MGHYEGGAARLGITERTIFRRVSRGVLKKRVVSEGVVMVLLTSQDGIQPDVMTDAESPSQDLAPASVTLVMSVMQSLMDRQSAAAEVFREELRQRDERLISLAQEVGRLSAELAWRRQPWWRRMKGVVAADGEWTNPSGGLKAIPMGNERRRPPSE